jgi:hypothetical protein
LFQHTPGIVRAAIVGNHNFVIQVEWIDCCVNRSEQWTQVLLFVMARNHEADFRRIHLLPKNSKIESHTKSTSSNGNSP